MDSDDQRDVDTLSTPAFATTETAFLTSRLDDLLSLHAPDNVQSWVVDDQHVAVHLRDLSFKVTHSCLKPTKVYATSDSVPRKLLDGLRISLRSMLLDPNGKVRWSVREVLVLLLQMVEETGEWLHRWRESQTILLGNSAGVKTSAGLDLGCLEDSAKHLLGQSIAEICNDIPDDLRLIHVEPVFRNDLVQRFLKRREEIKHDLRKFNIGELRHLVSPYDGYFQRSSDDRDELADALAQPKVTFHGAPRHVVSAIVRHGFVVPGTRIGANGAINQTRCGATYGAGIYSSPDPLFASAYMSDGLGAGGANRLRMCHPSQVPGMRLIVCATLMGRPLEVTRAEAWQTTGVHHGRAHSHVSPNKLEYVVFDAAQIVPCYVLHLDYEAETAKRVLAGMPSNPLDVPKRVAADPRKQTGYADDDEDRMPGAIKAKKQALKAAATKWFPYGYGTARGTNFVIEEIAEVSDDEEEYGDFQELRLAEQEIQEEDRQGLWSQPGNWFDEYQTVRKIKTAK
ncbi:hypothetical protein LTS10_010384 [Elasticomyces elasticus]|nr:hypothetical protein LTS10_010384 [Elasticomyces elasticus]